MKKFALLFLVILALGCGGGGFNFESGPLVRMVNAYGGTNVFGSVAASTILNNTGFATAGVARLSEGSANIVYTNANGGAILANEPINLENGKEYTVIGYPGNVLVLQQSFTPTVGNAAIRFAQAGGTLAPVVDIMTGPAGSTVAGATLYRDNFASGDVINFQNQQAGTTRFFILDETRTTVLYEGDVALAEGKHYTFIIGANNTVHFITVTED